MRYRRRDGRLILCHLPVLRPAAKGPAIGHLPVPRPAGGGQPIEVTDDNFAHVLSSAGDKPVLIDFWATWCKNCLTMDKTTLADPEVTAALSNYVKIKFQAEDPDAEPAQSLMSRFNAIGLPTYVILQPAGAGQRTAAQ